MSSTYPYRCRRMKTEHLLAAYGTLRLGEVNHRLLADVPCEWLDGVAVCREAGVGFHAAGQLV